MTHTTISMKTPIPLLLVEMEVLVLRTMMVTATMLIRMTTMMMTTLKWTRQTTDL